MNEKQERIARIMDDFDRLQAKLRVFIQEQDDYGVDGEIKDFLKKSRRGLNDGRSSLEVAALLAKHQEEGLRT